MAGVFLATFDFFAGGSDTSTPDAFLLVVFAGTDSSAGSGAFWTRFECADAVFEALAFVVEAAFAATIFLGGMMVLVLI